jgi:UDP-4-amino-4-deoxy-L-arabinose-oxoglutarate aminotransferase
MISHSKPWITEADREAVGHVLSGGMVAQGRLVEEFEARAGDYLGAGGGVAAASGTAALLLALRALGVGAGDEVILPTYVCKSVLEAVTTLGARGVLCDVGDGWNMTPREVAPHVTARTAAIIVVHIFGIAADARAFREFGVPLVEDCCQAFGAKVGQDFAGTIGAAGVYSFHAIKCLTTGEGGLAVSNDPGLLERMRGLRDGGEGLAPARVAAPLTDMQAALGLSQLARYEEFQSRRLKIAARYFDGLRDCPVRLPEGARGASMFYRFPVRAGGGDFRDQRRRFEGRGVQTRRGVDRLLHRFLGLDPELFPNAEKLFRETVSLPIYPALADAEIEQVIGAARAVWQR